MKKYLIMLAAIVTVAAGCLALTSCGDDHHDIEDSYIAEDLDGIWYGDMQIDNFNWRGHYWDDIDVEWEFFHTNPYGGYGYETDYYPDGTCIKRQDRFTYTVVNGYINIRYDDYENTYARIYQYSLTGRRFNGQFVAYDNNWRDGKTYASFSLRRDY